MSANLFANLPPGVAEEQVVELLSRPGVRIERIVSGGHSSPAGFWYDQPQGEWEDEAQPRALRPGDFVDIPAHRRHRVEWTHPDEPTVWLAVHYR